MSGTVISRKDDELMLAMGSATSVAAKVRLLVDLLDVVALKLGVVTKKELSSVLSRIKQATTNPIITNRGAFVRRIDIVNKRVWHVSVSLEADKINVLICIIVNDHQPTRFVSSPGEVRLADSFR